MYNHEPKDYICPLCLAGKGIENKKVQTRQADIFYKDDKVMAFIASSWWPNNPGHVIIIPLTHTENLYDLSEQDLYNTAELSKEVAIALKEVYQCPGVTIRQHNEPEGGQDVWHYHVHVIPRYKDDKLYELVNERRLTDPPERIPYAKKLKDYFEGGHNG